MIDATDLKAHPMASSLNKGGRPPHRQLWLWRRPYGHGFPMGTNPLAQ